MRWRARRSSHLLELNLSLRPPRPIGGPYPLKYEALTFSPPISPFRAGSKSPAETPTASASPHNTPPPKSKLSIYQSCPDPATGRRPERRKLYRHRPERFSFSRLRRHGFSTNSRSRIRFFIAFIAFQLATRLTSSQQYYGQGPNYLVTSVHFSLIFPRPPRTERSQLQEPEA